MRYIAVIWKESDSDYTVNFPDFPGCLTAGKTLEEARDMAVEALQLHIEGLKQDGDPLPEPSSFLELATQGAFGCFFISLD